MSLYELSGEGRSAWELVVDEGGSSFAAFTASNGSWASSGGEIVVSPSTVMTLAYLTAAPPIEACVFQADVKMKSTGSHAGTNRIGLTLGWSGDTSNNGGVYALSASGLTPASNGGDYTETQRGIASGPSTTNRFNLDQWYTLRIVVAGGVLTAYRNGVKVFTFNISVQTGSELKIGLLAYNCDAAFRNIKLWNLADPANMGGIGDSVAADDSDLIYHMELMA